jgi:hypothetical protein
VVDAPEGERQLLTAGQVEELLRLGVETAEHVRRHLEEILPDCERWELQQVATSRQARPMHAPPAEEVLSA